MLTSLRHRSLGAAMPFALFDGAAEGGGGGGGAAPGAGAAPGGGDGGAAAAAVADPAKAGGTVADGGAKPPVITAQAKWPDDWRKELAGEDKAQLAQLERLGSPGDIWKSYRELQAKVSSGELKGAPKPLAADATPEQQAAWRKEQGLPENEQAYLGALQLEGGLVPSEADKPLIEGFAKDVALAKGWSQDQMNDAVGWFLGAQAKVLADQQRADGEFKNSTLVELGREWGKDFEPNQNAVTNLINTLPEAIRDPLLTARLPNGRIVGDDMAFNQAMLTLAKQLNPAASLLPNIAGGGLQPVESRIAEIETKYMRAPQGTPEWQQYWHGAAGEKMQQEYRELLGARETMQNRARPA